LKRIKKVDMKIMIFLILALTFIGCSKDSSEVSPPSVDPETNDYRVEILGEVSGSFLGRTSSQLELALYDGDLAARNLTVRITNSDIPEKGAVLLSTGGYGDNFYGTTDQKKQTIDFALTKGLQVFEINWEGDRGWGTNVEGVGYTLALRGYSQVLKWLKANKMINSSIIVCHGGSGGSLQIAYGLTNYKLEEEIDFAILSAGPPTADLGRAVFGLPSDSARWPEGIGGLGTTDYIQGWKNNGDYCVDRQANPPGFVLETLESESLVNLDPAKDFDYGSVKLFFVNTDDETHADQQGLLYFEKITSAKDWTFLPNETAHSVASTEAGATRIREIISEIMN
jgi:hypothetical protein